MANKNKRNRGKGATTIIAVCLFLFLATTVFFAIEAAASGAELSDLENKEYILSRKNSELKEQILMRSSLTKVEDRAEELGFGKPSQVFYVPTQKTFAKLP